MKPTLATLKSFIRKNRSNLYIKVKSKFDGMIDMVDTVKDEFHLIIEDGEFLQGNSLGIRGAWIVGFSNDRIYVYDDENFTGYHVWNCCGSFNIVVKKEGR